MEKNEPKAQSKSDEFESPNLPYAWLATTFILPVLVVIVPQLFTKTASLTSLIIIALVLMSALLFVLWLSTHTRLYDESYKRQLLTNRLEEFKKEIALLQKNQDLIKIRHSELLEFEKENAELMNRIAEIEGINHTGETPE